RQFHHSKRNPSEAFLQISKRDDISWANLQRAKTSLKLDKLIAFGRLVKLTQQYSICLAVIGDSQSRRLAANLVTDQRRIISVDHGEAVLLILVRFVLKFYTQAIGCFGDAARA